MQPYALVKLDSLACQSPAHPLPNFAKKSVFSLILEASCDLHLLVQQQDFPMSISLFSGSDLPPKSQDVWLK